MQGINILLNPYLETKIYMFIIHPTLEDKITTPPVIGSGKTDRQHAQRVLLNTRLTYYGVVLVLVRGRGVGRGLFAIIGTPAAARRATVALTAISCCLTTYPLFSTFCFSAEQNPLQFVSSEAGVFCAALLSKHHVPRPP